MCKTAAQLLYGPVLVLFRFSVLFSVQVFFSVFLFHFSVPHSVHSVPISVPIFKQNTHHQSKIQGWTTSTLLLNNILWINNNVKPPSIFVCLAFTCSSVPWRSRPPPSRPRPPPQCAAPSTSSQPPSAAVMVSCYSRYLLIMRIPDLGDYDIVLDPHPARPAVLVDPVRHQEPSQLSVMQYTVRVKWSTCWALGRPGRGPTQSLQSSSQARSWSPDTRSIINYRTHRDCWNINEKFASNVVSSLEV